MGVVVEALRKPCHASDLKRSALAIDHWGFRKGLTASRLGMKLQLLGPACPLTLGCFEARNPFGMLVPFKLSLHLGCTCMGADKTGADGLYQQSLKKLPSLHTVRCPQRQPAPSLPCKQQGSAGHSQAVLTCCLAAPWCRT